jgi:DNA processing protein
VSAVAAGAVAAAAGPLATAPAGGRALPEEAYAAALAALDTMTPPRLLVLVRSALPLDAVWEGVVSGRSEGLPALDRLWESTDQLRARWPREAGRVDVEALWARCRDQSVVVLGRPGYPEELAADPLPPPVLFGRGSWSAIASPSVAIVGTRHATVGGMEVAAALGRDLAAAGVTVVSGLAKGIDGAAHRGALSVEGGPPPVAVVGSGLDVVYPRCNQGLWEAIAERGLLCSEGPPGTRPAAHRFPARNRILAALADVVVVVESRVRGGSLLTVSEAQQRGVPVMAVPGSVRSPASEGTNLLLVDGAPPAVDALDVLVALGLEARPARRGRRDRRPPPEPGDRTMLELFGTDALTLEVVVLRSGRPLPEVAVALGRLEAGGWLSRSGAWFEAVGAGGGR